MTARPTVVVAVHDGFYGCGTGAGYANHGFLHTLLALLPKGIHLAILPVRMAPDSPEYHPDWHRRVRAMLHDRDVSIHPINNGTGGRDRWGALDNFRRCSAEAADRIRRDILPRAGRVLIVAFDVPFFGLAALLPPAVRRHLIIVPRSSGLLHAPHDTERIAWERDSLHAGLSAGTRIGVISPYMRRHLREDYGIPHRALREFADGLCAVDWRRLTGPAADIGIELPGEFVFTMGRAEPYKGFEDLLEAIAILRGRRKRVPHLVFAATTETSRPTKYQQYLAARIAELGIEATIVHRFTPAVPRILTHPGIRAVVVPSRAEPFGRIPMEAFAASAGPVVTTTAHGLSGQITDGVTGFTCPPGAPDALAAALSRALALDSRRRQAMLRRARAHALRHYDHEAMVRGALAESAPWLMRAERENDRLRLPSCTRSIVTAGGSVQARPSVKVPIGLQARHWNTIRPERRVLVVAHHVTSLLRLVDMLTVFDSDPRVQLVFSWNGSDPFVDGIDECLGRLGAMVIPWHQAINTEFDLAIAANHGGLTEISADLIILPHGAGYTKNSPGEPGSRGAGEPGSRGAGEPGSRSVFGLSQEWLLYNGRPIASALVLGHESELARLRALTPAAAGIGVVAGDPAFDRMLVSRHLRMHYRQALAVAPHQKLIVVCTTWSNRSLLGTWPTLFRELTACLPRDEYRIVGLVHPNVWHGHGTLQVNTWLADAHRAGLTLIGPTEGWQAVLLAADLIIGDHGATTCYGAAEDLPILLGTFPDAHVAPDSVGELLGTLATRINRHETLRTQIEYAMQRHQPGHFAPIRDLMTSCPGESIERLRALCYRHMRLSIPATAPVTPVIPPELIAIDRPALLADHVTCTPTGPAEYTIARYPAGIEIDSATAGYLDRAFLVVHENHSQQSLLREAPVVLATDLAAGQDADEVLTDILRRWPAAQIAAVADADGHLILTRRGHRISVRGNNTGLGAAVVYEWLLTGVGEIPSELGVIVGSRRETFVLRRIRDDNQ